jgi:hypothetical protein
MLFKDITIIDENLDVLNNMYVGTLEDKISYIGSCAPQEDFGDVYEGKNKVLMTGLIIRIHIPLDTFKRICRKYLMHECFLIIFSVRE